MKPLPTPEIAAARVISWQYLKNFVSTDNPDPNSFPPAVYYRLTSWTVKQRQDGTYTLIKEYLTTFKGWDTIRRTHFPNGTAKQLKPLSQRLSQFTARLSKEVIKNVKVTY